MKKLSYIIGLGLTALIATLVPGHAQPPTGQSQTPGSPPGPASSAAASQAKDLLLSVGYGNSNNRLPYLKAVAKTKIDGKFRFVSGIGVRFFIQSDSPRYLLGKAVTGEKGEAIVYFPPTVRDAWLASSHQLFIALADPGMGFSSARAEADVTKAELKIDTAADRTVVVRLTELRGGERAPVKGVDIKVAVRRLGGDLNIGDSPTYSTDSTGSVSAAFKLDSLPGDGHGALTLVASVEDNDTYGTLSAERTVPWGVYRPWISNYEDRTLFARRGRSPYWLEGIAYSIILFVWGTLLYLLLQIRTLRRLGEVAE